MIWQQHIIQALPTWETTEGVSAVTACTISIPHTIGAISALSRFDAMNLLMDRIMSEDADLLRELAKR